MTNQKTVTIVQARTESTRLPRKVLLLVDGEPILVKMITRLKKSINLGKIIVATTMKTMDDEIYSLCVDIGVDCFRGNELDLLDRHYKCARKYNANIVAKIPSDVPLVDPKLVDDVFDVYFTGRYDYVSNLHPPTFPDGLDVEVFSFEALEIAWREATASYEREHTTPYIWDNPDKFKIGSVTSDQEKNYFMNYRWTIDYKEDLEFMQAVYKNFIVDNPNFRWFELVEFLDNNPPIATINQKYNGVNWYGNHIDDLKTFDKSMTKTD